jgi:hypothetical protein
MLATCYLPSLHLLNSIQAIITHAWLEFAWLVSTGCTLRNLQESRCYIGVIFEDL